MSLRLPSEIEDGEIIDISSSSSDSDRTLSLPPVALDLADSNPSIPSRPFANLANNNDVNISNQNDDSNSSQGSVEILPTPAKPIPEVVTLSDEEDDGGPSTSSAAPEAAVQKAISDVLEVDPDLDLEELKLRRQVLEGLLTRQNATANADNSNMADNNQDEGEAQMSLSPLTNYSNGSMSFSNSPSLNLSDFDSDTSIPSPVSVPSNYGNSPSPIIIHSDESSSSSMYSPISPIYSPRSPDYTPPPVDSPHSPNCTPPPFDTPFASVSGTYTPTSPRYSPHSPDYDPPTFDSQISSASMEGNYSPSSPLYSPHSPTYEPRTPLQGSSIADPRMSSPHSPSSTYGSILYAPHSPTYSPPHSLSSLEERIARLVRTPSPNHSPVSPTHSPTSPIYSANSSRSTLSSGYPYSEHNYNKTPSIQPSTPQPTTPPPPPISPDTDNEVEIIEPPTIPLERQTPRSTFTPSSSFQQDHPLAPLLSSLYGLRRFLHRIHDDTPDPMPSSSNSTNRMNNVPSTNPFYRRHELPPNFENSLQSSPVPGPSRPQPSTTNASHTFSSMDIDQRIPNLRSAPLPLPLPTLRSVPVLRGVNSTSQIPRVRLNGSSIMFPFQDTDMRYQRRQVGIDSIVPPPPITPPNIPYANGLNSNTRPDSSTLLPTPARVFLPPNYGPCSISSATPQPPNSTTLLSTIPRGVPPPNYTSSSISSSTSRPWQVPIMPSTVGPGNFTTATTSTTTSCSSVVSSSKIYTCSSSFMESRRPTVDPHTPVPVPNLPVAATDTNHRSQGQGQSIAATTGPSHDQHQGADRHSEFAQKSSSSGTKGNSNAVICKPPQPTAPIIRFNSESLRDHSGIIQNRDLRELLLKRRHSELFDSTIVRCISNTPPLPPRPQAPEDTLHRENGESTKDRSESSQNDVTNGTLEKVKEKSDSLGKDKSRKNQTKKLDKEKSQSSNKGKSQSNTNRAQSRSSGRKNSRESRTRSKSRENQRIRNEGRKPAAITFDKRRSVRDRSRSHDKDKSRGRRGRRSSIEPRRRIRSRSTSRSRKSRTRSNSINRRPRRTSRTRSNSISRRPKSKSRSRSRSRSINNRRNSHQRSRSSTKERNSTSATQNHTIVKEIVPTPLTPVKSTLPEKETDETYDLGVHSPANSSSSVELIDEVQNNPPVMTMPSKDNRKSSLEEDEDTLRAKLLLEITKKRLQVLSGEEQEETTTAVRVPSSPPPIQPSTATDTENLPGEQTTIIPSIPTVLKNTTHAHHPIQQTVSMIPLQLSPIPPTQTRNPSKATLQPVLKLYTSTITPGTSKATSANPNIISLRHITQRPPNATTQVSPNSSSGNLEVPTIAPSVQPPSTTTKSITENSTTSQSNIRTPRFVTITPMMPPPRLPTLKLTHSNKSNLQNPRIVKITPMMPPPRPGTPVFKLMPINSNPTQIIQNRLPAIASRTVRFSRPGVNNPRPTLGLGPFFRPYPLPHNSRFSKTNVHMSPKPSSSSSSSNSTAITKQRSPIIIRIGNQSSSEDDEEDKDKTERTFSGLPSKQSESQSSTQKERQGEKSAPVTQTQSSTSTANHAADTNDQETDVNMSDTFRNQLSQFITSVRDEVQEKMKDKVETKKKKKKKKTKHVFKFAALLKKRKELWEIKRRIVRKAKELNTKNRGKLLQAYKLWSMLKSTKAKGKAKAKSVETDETPAQNDMVVEDENSPSPISSEPEEISYSPLGSDSDSDLESSSNDQANSKPIVSENEEQDSQSSLSEEIPPARAVSVESVEEAEDTNPNQPDPEPILILPPINPEMEREEWALRERLVRSTLIRKMEATQARIGLQNTEAQLINARRNGISLCDSLTENLKQLAEEKQAKSQLADVLAKLRSEVVRTEQKLLASTENVNHLTGEVTTQQEVVRAVESECTQLATNCTEIGDKVFPGTYKVPDRHEKELKLRLQRIRRLTHDFRRYGQNQPQQQQQSEPTPSTSSSAKNNMINGFTKWPADPEEDEESEEESDNENGTKCLYPRSDFNDALSFPEPNELPVYEPYQKMISSHPAPDDGPGTSSEGNSDPNNSSEMEVEIPSVVVVDPLVPFCPNELDGQCFLVSCAFQHLNPKK